MTNVAQRKKPDVNRQNITAITKVYWSHVRRYPKLTSVVFLFTVAVHIVSVITPLYFKKLFDAITFPGANVSETYPLLINIFAIIALLYSLAWIFRRISEFAFLHFDAFILSDLLNTAFENLLGHSYKFFTDNFTGSLVRRVNRLSKSFEDIADRIQGQLLPLVIVTTGILIVLFNRNTLLGIILLSWIVLFVFVFYRVALWKTKYDRAKAEKDSEATGVISDALANAVTIKLFSRHAYEQSLYQKITDALREARLISWKIGASIDAVQGIFMLLAELALLYIALRLWKQGVLTVGDLVLLQLYVINLFDRMWEFGRVIRRMYESCADAAEMVEIMNTPYEIKDAPAAKPIKVELGSIEFRDIEFRFHGTRKVLDKFNLKIPAGEKVALVGPSGAGKTTVVTLLLRFHEVYDGQILIDGQNIARVTQESLRKNVSLVPQEPILFHRTLKENIRYGKLDATDEEVMEAAKQAHCHEFIMQLPYGYETYVGERGIKLSGGERQRVAIARAILKNAPILILDEATSSLDSESEALIQEALKNLMRGKTTLVIAHRLSTIMQMDRIIVIQNGRITETGTHQELLQKHGTYQKLWKIQAGGFAAT